MPMGALDKKIRKKRRRPPKENFMPVDRPAGTAAGTATPVPNIREG